MLKPAVAAGASQSPQCHAGLPQHRQRWGFWKSSPASLAITAFSQYLSVKSECFNLSLHHEIHSLGICVENIPKGNTKCFLLANFTCLFLISILCVHALTSVSKMRLCSWRMDREVLVMLFIFFSCFQCRGKDALCFCLAAPSHALSHGEGARGSVALGASGSSSVLCPQQQPPKTQRLYLEMKQLWPRYSYRMDDFSKVFCT